MGLALTLDIEDLASAPLLRLGQAVQRPDVRKVMGRAIVEALRAHFAERDEQSTNRFGAPSSHFWSQVKRSVQQPELVGGDGVKVAINHVGIGLKIFGGEVEPVNKQWLTIPARAEAYNHRAPEFNDLHFVFFRSGLAALVQNEQTSLGGRVHGSVTEKGRRKRETTGGGIFYWLVKHAHYDPDPEALPADSALEGAAVTEGEAYLQTELARQGGLAS